MKVVFNPFTGKFDIIPSVPADVGAGTGNISGTGVVGRVAEFVTDGSHIQAANIIAPVSNILTITNAATSTLAVNVSSGKTLTLTSTDNYALTVPATGTAVLTSNNLSALSATTSAQLASVISDETGNGVVVFNTRPTLKNTAETVQTLTYANPIVWDTDLGASAVVTLTGNTTIQAPINFRAGGYYTLKIIQDATGNRKMAKWSETFQWSNNILPILSSAPNGVDVFGFGCDGIFLYGTSNYLDVNTIYLDGDIIVYDDEIIYY